MALMDEFKEEREKIKNGTLKQKLSYFWEYYKWYVIVPFLIIGFLGSTIYQKVTAPEVILNGVLINAHNIETDTARNELIADFCKMLEIDTKEYTVTLNTTMSYSADDTSNTSNYESAQALMAWVAAGSIDFICSDYDTMTDLSYSGYFLDLREFLTEEEIQKYEPYFLYMDAAVSKSQNEAFENGDDTSSVSIPDCSEPETMEDAIPVMIDLSKNPKLGNIYANSDTLALGITTNLPNPDMVLEFLNFLIEE